MGIARTMMMGLLVAAFGMTGCKNSLKEENATLTQDNQALRDQMADRNAALDNLQTELNDCRSQLASKAGAPSSDKTGFEGIPGVEGSASGGEVTAAVEGDLLFDSGKTTLKANAKKSLDQIASVLNAQYGGAVIRIAGHTDVDPIKKSGFKTNYHLAFERAFAVREYLESKGVSATRMYLASYGPDEPRGADKKTNRRVEIVVVLN